MGLANYKASSTKLSTTLGSAKVDVSPRLLISPSAIFLNILRIIFPDLVFGKAGVYCILSGFAWGPISLTTDSSLITAWSNDFGFEGIFSRQVETLGHKGDILMAYTTSGTSKNVCMAAEKAKSMGIKVIGFTGDHKEMLLEDFADQIFKAPATETPLIQEIHTIIGHEICSNVERILFNFK